MTTRTLRLLIEYDGGCFQGFQKQLDAVTVQGAIETALRQITGQETPIIGAGRTDTGVHARGQVVSFTTDSPISPARLQRGINALAGPALAVIRAQEVPPDFHARYSALWRQYRYRMLLTAAPHPLRRHVTFWPGPEAPDLALMQQAWQILPGRHDFAPWQNVGSDARHAFCTITAVRCDVVGDELHFVIQANRFLYRMVRNLVGSVLRVGQGRLALDDFATMLALGTGKGGPAVPPTGLCLEAVGYELPWEDADDR